MSGRAFIDTNVLVYAVGPASEKRQKAEALLLSLNEAVISAQVASEFVNVCLKKQILPEEEVGPAARDFMDVLINVLRFEAVEEATIRRALDVREQSVEDLTSYKALRLHRPVLRDAKARRAYAA